MNDTPEELTTVDGTVKSIVFRNDENGFTILHVTLADDGRFRLAQREVTVLGTCAAAWEGEELHATGQWVNDPVRGRQFKAKSISCIPPKSTEGVRRYLASGLIYGIGPVLANRIVDKFGADTMDVLEHHSGRLREIPKLGPKKIEKIREAWREARGTRELMIFTQTYGISVAQTTKIYRRYGADSIAVIKADPYRLSRDIWGIGFTTADRIARAVGMPHDSPLRARASIVHTLQTEADEAGHCWTSEPDLLLHAQELVGISVEKLAEALAAEVDAGRVVREDGRIFMKDLFFAENRVAAKLRQLLDAPQSFGEIDPERAIKWWEQKTGFTLAPAQLNAVRLALRSKVCIVTGGPGVGKTTIIRALVEIYGARRVGGKPVIKVLLSAPTGRAAKRMTESTGAPAVTVHRLLKYNPQTNEFTYNADNPVPGDVFVFDETSMVDIKLMDDLLAALPAHATLILVGDTDQLPSVGPGNVLHDLIASGAIPAARLTEIFRQDSSGLIVRNAHHVNAGEPFETSTAGESDFYFIQQEDPQKALAYALDFMVTRIPRKFRMEPLQDVQVLTPMRKNLEPARRGEPQRRRAGAPERHGSVPPARRHGLPRGRPRDAAAEQLRQGRLQRRHRLREGGRRGEPFARGAVRRASRGVRTRRSRRTRARVRDDDPQVAGKRVPRRDPAPPPPALHDARAQPALHGHHARQETCLGDWLRVGGQESH